MLLTDSNTTIRALKTERDDLVARLTARYTYQTSLAWPLYVPDRQAYPNAITVWAAGLLAGAGLGVLARCCAMRCVVVRGLLHTLVCDAAVVPRRNLGNAFSHAAGAG